MISGVSFIMKQQAKNRWTKYDLVSLRKLNDRGVCLRYEAHRVVSSISAVPLFIN